ncbi:MAG: GatB/YqeY domain-containing protein [Myxococcales bacterium]|nr:GatB/YqeY domain-containing protein [Myxococcales bacterium]
MGILQQLDEDLKQAMRARDQLRLNTIRNVRSAVLQQEVDSGEKLGEDEVLAVIQRLVKQRDEAIAQYREGGREDLVDQESAEKAVLAAYLPAAPGAEQIEAVVAAVVSELGASSMKDMGAVMKEARSRLGPAADGKAVSAAVKARLSAG